MGLFDTIAVSDALPTNPEMDALGLNRRDWSLQTKSFDCAMDLYVLQDGQLYLKKWRIVRWVDGDPKARSITARLGHLHRDEPYLHPVDFTGQFTMYDYRDVDSFDCWCEWMVTAVNGKVNDIQLIKFNKTDNAERKAREKAYQDEIDADRAKWCNRFFFHTKPIIWLRNRIHFLLAKISSFFFELSQRF